MLSILPNKNRLQMPAHQGSQARADSRLQGVGEDVHRGHGGGEQDGLIAGSTAISGG